MKITRRHAIRLGGIAAVSAIGYGAYRVARDHTDIFVDHLYPFIKATARWTSEDFTAFLSNLNKDQQRLVLTSLGKKEDQTYDVAQIKKEVIWVASNVVTYPFKDKTNYDYHEEIVSWLAGRFGVGEVNDVSTFVLERKIMEAVFVQVWDKLPPEQRRKALDKIDAKGAIEDRAGLALAGGAAALAALSSTVYLSGFAFYTTLSSVIFATADFFGVTLPIWVYIGTSSATAVLSGPVGLAILGLAAAGSLVFLGRADEAKTAAFVIQFHLIKIQALVDSHRLDKIVGEMRL